MGRLFWFFVSLIAYTYFGYPLVLGLLVRLRPRPWRAQSIEPSATLLIAAYNEAEVIADKLENSLALDYPVEKLQILVAADGSQDRTVEIVEKFAARGVELSYQPQRAGKMAAINRAMAQAHGEIVVFSDANNAFPTDVLRELVRPFADAEVGAVTGAKHILQGDGALGSSEGLYWRYESLVKKLEARVASCTGVAGEIFAMRRALFSPPPREIINDDFYLAMRVLRRGYRVVYVPSAHSYERVSPSAEDEALRRSRIVAGRYQALFRAGEWLPWRSPLLIWQVVSHKFLRPLVPFAMLGALLTNFLAVLLPPRGDRQRWLHLSPPFNWLTFGGQVLFYLAAWLGNRWEREEGWRKVLYLPAFLVNSNLAALRGLYAYLRGQHSAAWQRVRRREGLG
jgi:cellulose synthase/poly-beta-1,6-N-acetylglucosamine synthase-like glycosyltransferase